jgi:hypothetical protein
VADDLTAVAVPDPRPRRPYGRRFGFAYAALALVAVGAVAAFVAVVVQPGKVAAPEWSTWSPTADDSTERAQEIAQYVGGRYRLSSGAQLVGVEASPLRVQDAPVSGIAIRKPAADAGAEDPITVLPADDAVAFILCGLGENCAIGEGTPTPERQRLVRREALELALYTFRYMDDKNSVIALLPPPLGQEPTLAVLLRREDLEAELDRPVHQTLSPDVPQATTIAPSEIETIDRLTIPTTYRFRFQEFQDGTAALVLDDVKLQGE